MRCSATQHVRDWRLLYVIVAVFHKRSKCDEKDLTEVAVL